MYVISWKGMPFLTDHGLKEELHIYMIATISLNIWLNCFDELLMNNLGFM